MIWGKPTTSTGGGHAAATSLFFTMRTAAHWGASGAIPARDGARFGAWTQDKAKPQQQQQQLHDHISTVLH
jgi:hypothetical protein